MSEGRAAEMVAAACTRRQTESGVLRKRCVCRKCLRGISVSAEEEVRAPKVSQRHLGSVCTPRLIRCSDARPTGCSCSYRATSASLGKWPVRPPTL